MPNQTSKVITARNLKDQPMRVLRTEVPELAKALGITPAELFRNIADAERASGRVVESGECTCCHSDSW